MKTQGFAPAIVFLLILLFSAACSSPEPEERKERKILAVVNKGDNSVTVIDRRTYRILGEVLTGIGPHEITVNQWGTAVVSNYGNRYNPGSSLTVIDLPRLKLERFIDLPRIRTPHGVVFLADGERVAVIAEDSKRILVVNVETGEIEQSMRTLQDMPHMVVLNEKKNQIFVSNIVSNTVTVYDLDTISGLKVVRTGTHPEGMGISPDESEVWIAERVGDSISVLDTESLEIVDNVSCPGGPLRVSFTPDGRHVLVSASLSSEVVVFNARTRVEELRISLDYSEAERNSPDIQRDLRPVPTAISIEPDSSLCYVTSGNVDLITVIDLTKWAIQTRLRTGDLPDGLVLWDEPRKEGEGMGYTPPGEDG